MHMSFDALQTISNEGQSFDIIHQKIQKVYQEHEDALYNDLANLVTRPNCVEKGCQVSILILSLLKMVNIRNADLINAVKKSQVELLQKILFKLELSDLKAINYSLNEPYLLWFLSPWCKALVTFYTTIRLPSPEEEEDNDDAKGRNLLSSRRTSSFYTDLMELWAPFLSEMLKSIVTQNINAIPKPLNFVLNRVIQCLEFDIAVHLCCEDLFALLITYACDGDGEYDQCLPRNHEAIGRIQEVAFHLMKRLHPSLIISHISSSIVREFIVTLGPRNVIQLMLHLYFDARTEAYLKCQIRLVLINYLHLCDEECSTRRMVLKRMVKYCTSQIHRQQISNCNNTLNSLIPVFFTSCGLSAVLLKNLPARNSNTTTTNEYDDDSILHICTKKDIINNYKLLKECENPTTALKILSMILLSSVKGKTTTLRSIDNIDDDSKLAIVDIIDGALSKSSAIQSSSEKQFILQAACLLLSNYTTGWLSNNKVSKAVTKCYRFILQEIERLLLINKAGTPINTPSLTALTLSFFLDSVCFFSSSIPSSNASILQEIVPQGEFRGYVGKRLIVNNSGDDNKQQNNRGANCVTSDLESVNRLHNDILKKLIQTPGKQSSYRQLLRNFLQEVDRM